MRTPEHKGISFFTSGSATLLNDRQVTQPPCIPDFFPPSTFLYLVSKVGWRQTYNIYTVIITTALKLRH